MTLRSFRGDADMPKVKAFLTGRERWDNAPGTLPDYWNIGKSTVGTFQLMFDGPRADHQLCEDEHGVVQAHLWVCPEPDEHSGGGPKSWRLLMHPADRSAAQASPLIRFAENRLNAEMPSSKPIETVAYGRDQQWISLLAAHDYAKAEPLQVNMTRRLDTDIALPRVPDGYSISTFNPETDQAEQAAAQVDAFANLPEADEWSLGVTARFVRWFEGRDDLDLIAKTPDGTVASMAIFLVDPVTCIGELEVVGTRAAHQQKGLSRAVLLTGLQHLKSKGMNAAVVRTGIDNQAAIALYESVGFRIVDRLFKYEKTPD